MSTPEPSTERKRAGKLGYIVAVSTAVLLLISYPIFGPYRWIGYLPVVLGMFVYYGWRILTGDLNRKSIIRFLARLWVSLGK